LMNTDLLLAGAVPPFLGEVVAFIAVSSVIAYICFRLGLVPIVGFLVAGVLIGPNGLGFVRNQELVDATAEIGVILLLFTIGIEFSLEKLDQIKKLIFIGGGLQVILSTLGMAGLLFLLGIDWRVGIFTGFLIALSSTAIVLKLLTDRGETNSVPGQISLGLLIFQDLAVIVMVLLVPVLGGQGGSPADVGIALGKAALIIAVVLIFARKLMPKVLEAVARTCSPELFLLTVIAICFGTAYLTSLAGVSVSLGAFLAGLLVSESRFSQHAFSEILPLQILFSATFFVSVGMLLNLEFLAQNVPFVLTAIAIVLIVKVITTGASVFALGYKLPVVAASGLLLAQVGEFSFVLERAGREVNLFPAGMAEEGSQTFIAATVILMVITPLLAQIGMGLSRRIESRLMKKELAEGALEPRLEIQSRLENHVIVAGYGQAARKLVRVLAGSGIPYIITTLSPIGANEAEAEGLPVLRGDASKLHTLTLAGIERSKMLVIADDDPSMAHRIASVARNFNPTLQIVVRTRYIADVESLTKAGVDRVVLEELESIVQLLAGILRDYQISREEIEADVEAIRSGGYAALRERMTDGEPIVTCQGLDQSCFDTRTVTVRGGAPISSQPIASLRIEEEYGVKIQEIRREGIPINDLPSDFVVQPGDEIVLSGSAAAFAKVAPLFRTEVSEEIKEATLIPSARYDRYGIDLEQVIELKTNSNSTNCSHLDRVQRVTPSAKGCGECLRTGDDWVHLRICMTCGHVGCCDDSKNKHATKHYHETSHPIIRSLEPGEDWAWCYPDEITL
jgi:CPA2 family monovalent cation:H+ antiporter-2